VNDILRLEDMNTIGAIGDVRLVPMNMHTLEQAAGGTKEDGAADGAAQAASSASTGEAADVQRTALNGAQVTSLLQVAEFVSQSVLSKEAAKGVINVSFPATGEAQINRIVDNIEPMQTRETNAQADNSSADGANDSESDDGDAGAVHGPWVLDAAARVLHREANAVARAAKSTSGDYRAFDERVSRFFAEDRRTIVEAFAPLFAALGCPTARLSVIATDHAEQRRTEALDAFRCGSVADLCERWQSIEPALTAGIVLMNAEAALDKKELCHAS
jgi:hypothetical protein